MNQEKREIPELSPIRVEILLNECELCTSEARHMEGLIWTTAGVLGTASIVGIGFLSNSIPASPRADDYFLRVSMAVLSIIFIFLWRKMTSRWYSIQRVMFYRIVEIEEELGMYKERYINYLDETVKGGEVSQSLPAQKMITKLRKKHSTGGARKAVRYMSWVLIIGWFLFLVSQLAALQGWI